MRQDDQKQGMLVPTSELDDIKGGDAKAKHAASMAFPIGQPNDGFARYFSGQSFIAPVSMEQVMIFNSDL